MRTHYGNRIGMKRKIDNSNTHIASRQQDVQEPTRKKRRANFGKTRKLKLQQSLRNSTNPLDFANIFRQEEINRKLAFESDEDSDIIMASKYKTKAKKNNSKQEEDDS